MITNVIKSLVEKMTTTNSAKIFEIKHITSPNKKDNIKWEQIPRTEAQLKNYFMWQLNKLVNQQTIITIIFTVVTDAKQHTIINKEVMEYTKNEHLRLALHQFETANLKEIGFIRDLNINLTYRSSWVSTVLSKCTVPAKLPYFEIIPRKLYVNQNNNGHKENISTIAPVIRCDTKNAQTIITYLVKCTNNDKMGPYTFVPMSLVYDNKQEFINQMRVNNQTAKEQTRIQVSGLASTIKECTAKWFKKEEKLQTATWNLLKQGAKHRIIKSIEKTTRTKSEGVYNFICKKEDKEEATKVVKQICTIYNTLMVTTDQEHEFKEANIEEQQTNERFRKTATQPEEELKKFNRGEPKRTLPALCFDQTPPPQKKKKMMSYKSAVTNKPNTIETDEQPKLTNGGGYNPVAKMPPTPTSGPQAVIKQQHDLIQHLTVQLAKAQEAIQQLTQVIVQIQQDQQMILHRLPKEAETPEKTILTKNKTTRPRSTSPPKEETKRTRNKVDMNTDDQLM